jgi:TolA-binding protein
MNDLLDMAVRVLRDETAVEADGAITRQRIEAEWLQHRARGRAVRRLTMVAAVVLVLGGGALAATNLFPRARPADPGLTPAKSTRPVGHQAPPEIPASAPVMSTSTAPEAPSPPVSARPSSQPVGVADAATSAYAAAHRAHFVGRNWSQALGLWARYLRLAPGGPLAPEAHFNRAICLLHLDRRNDAVAELQPFASGRWGSYRQREARHLLEAIAASAR